MPEAGRRAVAAKAVRDARSQLAAALAVLVTGPGSDDDDVKALTKSVELLTGRFKAPEPTSLQEINTAQSPPARPMSMGMGGPRPMIVAGR